MSHLNCNDLRVHYPVAGFGICGTPTGNFSTLALTSKKRIVKLGNDTVDHRTAMKDLGQMYADSRHTV